MRPPILSVENLSVNFRVDMSDRLFRHDYRTVRAVDRVGFELTAGETLGIVGESGCGKSTLARAILGLVKPTSGRVCWLGENLSVMDEAQLRDKRRQLQMIFQDPFGSLDPRMNVGQIVGEPLKNFYPSMSRMQVNERVSGMLKMVGLSPELINRYPHEFSGGQAQRIGIARALVINPRLVVCDEPVSALDVSVQAQIINLLKDLQKKLQLSLIFIAHDLSVVRHVSDRVLVMYLGRIMEIAERERIYATPAHPYTRALIDSVPIPDPETERRRTRRSLGGEPPS
ncbi:MAG: ABC transporter ATP-binding protein, partial [Wenzhouxiangellaceae bacterium]